MSIGFVSISKRKLLRYGFKQMIVDTSRFTVEVLKAFDDFIVEVEQDEEFVYSFRIALKSDKRAMREFIEARTCCGSKKVTRKIKGEAYMFGCNFGH